MESKSVGTLKRGDTFALYAKLTGTDGNPLLGAASKLRSQVRTEKDLLLAELQVTEYADPVTNEKDGTYIFRASESTENWPKGTHYLDIEYTDGDIIVSTETLSIKVIGDVTHD